MKAAAFEYQKPTELSAVVSALRASNGEAKLFGGGQSLGPMLNLRLARPKKILDVSTLPALKVIEDLGAAWRIGGGVTHAMLEDRVLVSCEPLALVARGIAYRAIRNRGTVGGSLAHADPAADWPLTMPALGATIVIAGVSGERRVAAESFMTAAFGTALAEDEIIAAVEVPKISADARWGYWKFCRKTGEFPEASAAVLLDPQRKVARVWVGALNGAPQSLNALAVDIAQRGFLAISDLSVSQALEPVLGKIDAAQRRLHQTAVRRAVQLATA